MVSGVYNNRHPEALNRVLIDDRDGDIRLIV